MYCARWTRSTSFAPPGFEFRRFEQNEGLEASLQMTSTSTTLADFFF